MPDDSEKSKNEPLQNTGEIGAGQEVSGRMSEGLSLPAVNGLYCEKTLAVDGKEFAGEQEKTIQDLWQAVNVARSSYRDNDDIAFIYMDDYRKHSRNLLRISKFEQTGQWPIKGSQEYEDGCRDCRAFLDEYDVVRDPIFAAINKEEKIGQLSQDIAEQGRKSVELKEETVKLQRESIHLSRRTLFLRRRSSRLEKKTICLMRAQIGASILAALAGAGLGWFLMTYFSSK